MMASSTYALAAVLVALLLSWIFSVALSLRIALLRGKSISPTILLGVLFGPIAAMGFLIRYGIEKKGEIENRRLIARFERRFSDRVLELSTSFLGFIFVSLINVCVFISLRSFFSIQGEPLQIPLAISLIFTGLVAGFGMAVRLRRIAFLEVLFVAALFSWLPFIFPKEANSLFTFGTAAAYYAAILVAGEMIFLLSLVVGGAVGFLLGGEGRVRFSFRYEAFIGKRFLMAKRGRHVVSLITLISVFAVMAGCAGMVIVMSVMDGFSSDLRNKILGTNAHLVLLKYGDDFGDHPTTIRKTMEVPGVLGATPFIYNEVMISSENNLTGAVVKGIDSQTIGNVTKLPEDMVEGKVSYLRHPDQIPAPGSKIIDGNEGSKHLFSNPLDSFSNEPLEKSETQNLPAILIGQEMARNLKVFLGDAVNVVSPVGDLGPSGPVPRARAFRIGGIFYSGMYEYDSKFAYISLGEAQSFFGLSNSVTGIEYKVDNIDHTQAISREIRRLLGGYPYYTKDWMELNRNLFSALKLEKIAMFIILAALIFMASLLILVALVMVVMEKGKEIAILKSIGGTNVSIMKIFVIYGLSIGTVGAGLGVCFGLLLSFLMKFVGIGLDPEVYYISYLPVRIDLGDVALVLLSAIIVSFLATIPPSLFASRLRPVEGLRYE